MFSENYVFISCSQYSVETLYYVWEKNNIQQFKVMSPICKSFKSEKHIKNM